MTACMSSAVADDAPGVVRMADLKPVASQQGKTAEPYRDVKFSGVGTGAGNSYSSEYPVHWCYGAGSQKGVPLLGRYQITYASQPSYADPRDSKAWAAQGYGMPVTVPTAPLVRYSYNYSHGTPASRLTPLSTYNPSTSRQPLFLRSW